MKRLFPSSLALLLVLGSLGHVFAAALCPRMLGHNCCPTKASSHQHSSQSHQHPQDMALDAESNNGMSMSGSSMAGMTMDDADIPPPASLAVDDVTLLSTSEALVPADKLDMPIEACTHCLSHSGIQNAPISSVSVPDQSNRDRGSGPLALARFFARPALMVAQIGLPGEHAPPD